MANLWSYKNHLYRSKYPIVLLNGTVEVWTPCMYMTPDPEPDFVTHQITFLAWCVYPHTYVQMSILFDLTWRDLSRLSDRLCYQNVLLYNIEQNSMAYPGETGVIDFSGAFFANCLAFKYFLKWSNYYKICSKKFKYNSDDKNFKHCVHICSNSFVIKAQFFVKNLATQLFWFSATAAFLAVSTDLLLRIKDSS